LLRLPTDKGASESARNVRKIFTGQAYLRRMFSLLMIGLDWQIVILAGCVCLLAAIAAASLFALVRQTSGRARATWVIAGAVVVLSASTAIEVVVRQAHGIGLIAAGAVIGLGLGAGLYWLATGPAGAREDLRDAALSFMTQGLCMFDAAGRLVFWNKRFAEIYRVEGRLRIGFTLRDILRERIAVGTLAEDPDEYVGRATTAARNGKKFTHVFELSDGRKIAVNNEPRPSGGWVSTHEDISERLQVAQERAAARDQERRRALVDGAIAAFRPQMESLIESVSGHASAMRGTASSLFDCSQRTSEHAVGAVRSFDEASANVRTAAEAADELSQSIADISDQLVQMSDVVRLATSEAARAGEAGRGFAVVASEVKSLAVQTAKATEEIANHILAVQTSTGDAVEAIRLIALRTQEINKSTFAVSAAVKQQNAATGEIKHNVSSAADATNEVAAVLGEVAGATTQTRSTAQIVLDASETVAKDIARLRANVESFLAQVAL
jgi:methyl-accepting chemotaxis protein